MTAQVQRSERRIPRALAPATAAIGVGWRNFRDTLGGWLIPAVLAKDGRDDYLHQRGATAGDAGHGRFEEALRESEGRLRDFLDNANDLIHSADPEGRLLYTNLAWRRTLGYGEEEIPGLSLFDVIAPESQAHCAEVFRRVIAGESTGEIEAIFVGKDGRRIAVSGNSSVRLHDGVPVSTRSIFRDVTRRNEAERSLRQSEERFRSLVQNSSDIIAIVGADGLARYVSPSIRRVLGYRAEDRIGKSAFDLVHTEDVGRVRGMLAGLIADPGASVTAEFRMYHADGTVRHVEGIGTNLIADPTVGGVVVNYRDVTARRETERALRESEERFRTAFENAPVGVALIGLDRRYLRANRALCEMLGYSEEELRTRTSVELTHPEDLGESSARALRALEEGSDNQTIEKRYVCSDGRVVWALSSVSLVRDAEGGPSHFVALYQDITDRKQAEAGLREAETRYRSLVETIPAVTYLDELDGISTATYISPQVFSMLGFTAQERLADPELWVKHLHPEDREGVLAENDHSNETGEMFDMEYRMISRDGRTVWVWDASVVVRGEGGHPSYRQGVMFDVTDRRQTEEALKASEARLRTVIEQSPLGIHIFAPDGASLLTNDAWNELWCLDAGESSENTNIFEDEHLRAAGLLGHIRRSVDGAAVETPPLLFDPAVAGREGDPRWLRALIYPVRNDDGHLREVALLLEDVTERKEAEKRLEATELRYRTLVEQVPAVVYIDGVDESNAAIFRSAHVEEILGYAPEEFYSDPEFWQKKLHPEDRERVLAENERTNESGEPFKIEYRMIREDGRVVWVRDEAVLVEDESGGPLYWHGVFLDITERKRAERALREGELKLRTVVENTPVILFALDGEGVITVSEGRGLEALGRMQTEMVGRSVFEAYPDDPSIVEHARRALAGEEIATTVDIHGMALEVRCSPIWEETGELSGVIGVAMDVTERKEAEERVRFQAQLLEQVQAAVIATDIEGTVTHWNEYAERLYGWSREEALGRGPDELLVGPTESEVAEEILEKLRAGEAWEGEFNARNKDGSTFPVHVTDSLVRDADGSVVGIVGVSTDITESKRAEREMKEANRRLGELASLRADFAAMVAHEIGAPLATIRGFAEMLETSELGPAEQADVLAKIGTEVEGLATLVADVSSGAAIEREDFSLVPRPVPVDGLLEDAARFARTLPGNHPMVVEDGVAGAEVHADPYRIGQVLRNLLSNAAKYSPDGAPITVRTGREDGRVRVEVSDRGRGVHPEDAERIFEKFGRGRDGDGHRAYGVGLGLYLSRRIVRAHGGELAYGPAPGAGSVFYFDLGTAR